jgi:predicted phosphate transport protein (TIGR00153 family)
MFFPRKSKIFDELLKQSAIVKEAAQAFRKITGHWEQLENDSSALQRLERQADELVHSITDDIEKTFILPLDKEDIADLTESLDDVVDNLEEAVNRLNIYKISEGNDALREFSDLIEQSAVHIHKGISLIKDGKIASEDLASCGKTLRDLETQGDKVHRRVLEDLMGNGSSRFFNVNDYLSILKWKEIFQILEDTLDKCDHIGKLFSRLRIKYI